MHLKLLSICLLLVQLTCSLKINDQDEMAVIQGVDEIHLMSARQPNAEIKSSIKAVFDDMGPLFDTLGEKTRTLKMKSAEEGWIGGSEKTYLLSKKSNLVLAAYSKLLKANPSKDYSSSNCKVPYPYCPRIESDPCNATDSYRTIDGSCNNVDKPWWGRSETPLKRLLASCYDDDVTEPRVKSVVKGKYLPNARRVAIKLFQPKQFASEWTNFMTFFGQFLVHDLALIGQTSYRDGNRIWCPCNSHDSECFNIPIPREDVKNKDQKCFSFVRSLPSIRDFDCSLGPREQLNVQTHWLDLSDVYGHCEETAAQVRNTTNGGLLNVCLGKYDEEFLPLKVNRTCRNKREAPEYSRRQKCYTSGDPRAEDNVVLTSIHTIFLREHNRIARELATVNPGWNDETLYQETRKILIAQFQHIIYHEYLPALLGERVSKLYNLLPLRSGFFNRYDDELYPQIINEFATAAFRYGHLLLTKDQWASSRDFRKHYAKPSNYFLFNNDFYKNEYDDIVRGSLAYYSYAPKTYYSNYYLDFLFNGVFFKDSRRWSLPAMNIQRGRDHGLPGYNKYRHLCGCKLAKKFEDFDNIPPQVVKKLKSVYLSVDDVDLFTGMFAEYPLQDGMLGSTAACVVAKQFRDLKFSDRFYYETSNSTIGFTQAQLDNIRTVTMARVLCNTVDVSFLQKFPFFVANPHWNPYVECTEVPKLNLTLWAQP